MSNNNHHNKHKSCFHRQAGLDQLGPVSRAKVNMLPCEVKKRARRCHGPKDFAARVRMSASTRRKRIKVTLADHA